MKREVEDAWCSTLSDLLGGCKEAGKGGLRKTRQRATNVVRTDGVRDICMYVHTLRV